MATAVLKASKRIDLPLREQEDPMFIILNGELSLVSIDENGQRPRDPKHVQEIADEWLFSKAKPLQACFNEDATWYLIFTDENGDRWLETDGSLHLFDSGHTYEAALLLSIKHLPIQLYPAMTKPQAYRRFTDQDDLSNDVKLDSKVRVLQNAGDDDMLFIASIMKRLGWPESISAQKTAIRVALYDAPTRDHFYNVGRLLNAVWPDQAARHTEPALQAASLFLIKWQDNPNYTLARLVEKFKGTDLAMLLNGFKQTRKNKPRNDRESATVHGMLLYSMEFTYDADRRDNSRRLRPLFED